MHSLNPQVDQRLFKSTTARYKHSFLRQRTAGAADRKDGEAGVWGMWGAQRAEGKGQRAPLSSTQSFTENREINSVGWETARRRPSVVGRASGQHLPPLRDKEPESSICCFIHG